jgi:putative PIG3 family NAD(P)H quinone oxidoreductase
MRAIVITQPGGPDVLQVRSDVAVPEPGAGEILVRVHATAVNRAELLQRRDGYAAPPGSAQTIPGLEYAGVVESTGPSARRWSAGDRVMGLVGGGSYAEYVVVHEEEALPVPDALSLTEAAAVPEVFLTAHDALFTQARLSAGETLLVHAAGSGVGTAALQLAPAAGARVLGTARSAWKLERASSLGLDVAIDTSREAFPDAVKRATDGAGVDVVLDLVGGDYLPASIEAAARRARIVLVGLVAGPTATLNLRQLLTKRIELRGTVMRARSLPEKIAVAEAFARAGLPLLAAGRVQPVIDRVLPATEAAAAHALLEANETF